MPYQDPNKQREYQRRWVEKRRADYLKDKECAQKSEECEGPLEVDHINPSEKWTHRFWSYTEAKRNEELKKCQVLCRKHHVDKTIGEMGYGQVHGTTNSYDYYNCRCDDCKAIHNQTVNAWRWKTGKRKQRKQLVDPALNIA